MVSYLQFLGEFIRNPRQVGAIAPSSPSLTETVISGMSIEKANVVVELGPGNGAFTSQIRARLKPNAVFFTMEINPSMCEKLKQKLPDVNVYCDSASNVRHYLAQHGAQHADCIISSLPWAAFRSELQNELMTAVYDALKPGGEFSTFAYLQGSFLPSGKRFRRCLEKRFASIERSSVVWQNLPPAFVYRCRKAKARLPR